MNRMMDRMILNMSVQDREQMLLKMMPQMMKDVDMLKMMPGMMSGMGRLLNVTGVVTFIRQVLKDEEIKGQLEKLTERVPQLSRKMQSMMADMRPAMITLMSGMMDFMGDKVMPVMMPMMSEMMPVMMKEKMPDVMARHETVKELVPRMMMEVLPHCVQTFSPAMESEERDAFINRLRDAIAKADVSESHEAEKEDEAIK
jgi:hypothetical protein